MMKEPRGLIHGVVRPLSDVRCVCGFVGSDVRVAEKITRRHDDITERGDIIDCSEPILRPLGVVRRFVTVSTEINGRGWCLLRCHFLFPFTVFTHAEYVCFTKGSQSLGGLLEKTEVRGGPGDIWKAINIHNLLVMFAQVEILFVVEEKILRWGGDD